MAFTMDRSQRDFRFAGNPQPLDLSGIKRRLATNEFNKIKVGAKSLKDDAFLDIDAANASRNYRKIDKDAVLKAISDKNYAALRVISNYYYDKSGIYERLVKYMAHFYRYDIFVTPVQYDKKVPETKVVEGWYRVCLFLENSKLKKHLSEIAVKVIKNGCYYGYRLDQKDRAFLQELPVDWCRSRYTWNGKPAVEFNVKYFDDTFADTEYRLRVVKMFPKEIRQAYVAYKKGTLPQDFNGDTRGWVLLDPSKTVKFNIDGSDCPIFASIIPHLLDLEEAQAIDQQKMLQQILKIIIQKFPLDKNFNLVFDVDEMNAFHQMAVDMLGDAIGVDVLSTLADVDVADMSDKGNVSAVDQLEKVERTVYNEAGVSQLQFNSDGSAAITYSISNDEGSITDLVCQFEEYVEDMISPLNKLVRKKLYYRVNILPTTVYNYKEMSNLYREQTMLGFSKLLPQVALGMSQAEIISTAIFENQMLKLDDVFTPPQMSSTVSKKDTEESDKSPKDEEASQEEQAQNAEEGQEQQEGAPGDQPHIRTPEENEGRPPLSDTERSEQTVRNQESG